MPSGLPGGLMAQSPFKVKCPACKKLVAIVFLDEAVPGAGFRCPEPKCQRHFTKKMTAEDVEAEAEKNKPAGSA